MWCEVCQILSSQARTPNVLCPLSGARNASRTQSLRPIANLGSRKKERKNKHGKKTKQYSKFPHNKQSSRSEERRVGKECVSTGRSRWSRQHKKKKKTQN